MELEHTDLTLGPPNYFQKSTLLCSTLRLLEKHVCISSQLGEIVCAEADMELLKVRRICEVRI